MLWFDDFFGCWLVFNFVVLVFRWGRVPWVLTRLPAVLQYRPAVP